MITLEFDRTFFSDFPNKDLVRINKAKNSEVVTLIRLLKATNISTPNGKLNDFSKEAINIFLERLMDASISTEGYFKVRNILASKFGNRNLLYSSDTILNILKNDSPYTAEKKLLELKSFLSQYDYIVNKLAKTIFESSKELSDIDTYEKLEKDHDINSILNKCFRTNFKNKDHSIPTLLIYNLKSNFNRDVFAAVRNLYTSYTVDMDRRIENKVKINARKPITMYSGRKRPGY